MQLDVDGLRDSDGSRVDILSPGGASPARAKIGEYLLSLGFSPDEWQWQWGACNFQLNLHRRVAPIFARVFGVSDFTVVATARARLNNTDSPVSC